MRPTCPTATLEALLAASLSPEPATVLRHARLAGLLDPLDPGDQACLEEAARRGRLAPTCEALGRALGHARDQATHRRTALAAPLLCLFLGAVFVAALVLWVLPGFREFYRALNIELPVVTTALLALTERSSWAWLGLALPARRALRLALGLLRSPAAARWEPLARRLPILGPTLRSRAEAEVAARVQVALAAGLDLAGASALVARHLPAGLPQARARVLADSLAGLEIPPAAAGWSRRERVLRTTLEERHARLAAWMEGLALATLGFLVFGVLLALRLPFACSCIWLS